MELLLLMRFCWNNPGAATCINPTPGEPQETEAEPLAASEPEEQQLVSEPEEAADAEPAAASLGEIETESSLSGDPEERAIPEPRSAPVEVEPELAAAVEEAFEG